jgi:hypothetical protein
MHPERHVHQPGAPSSVVRISLVLPGAPAWATKMDPLKALASFRSSEHEGPSKGRGHGPNPSLVTLHHNWAKNLLVPV